MRETIEQLRELARVDAGEGKIEEHTAWIAANEMEIALAALDCDDDGCGVCPTCNALWVEEAASQIGASYEHRPEMSAYLRYCKEKTERRWRERAQQQ